MVTTHLIGQCCPPKSPKLSPKEQQQMMNDGGDTQEQHLIMTMAIFDQKE